MSAKIVDCVVFYALFFLIFQYVSLSPSPAKRSDAKKDQCNKTVEIYEDVSSPEVTQDNFGKPMTCWYRFRSFRGTPKDWILRIKFNKFKIGNLLNATHCEGGYLQIVDGNAKTDVSNRKEPGIFCGESEQPQTFMSETSFVKVLFHVENYTDQTYLSFDTRAEQQLVVYLRYGQHPELYPNRRGEVVQGSYCERIFRDCRLQTCYVQSPAYPGIYPRNLHCRYYLNTRLPFIKLYIENEEFNIDGQRCENIMTCPMRPISSGEENCPYDYIKIYDGKNEFSPVIGTFCGMGKFPYSIIGTSQDLFVEFVSSPAGPLLNTGFHFNVGNWPGHVDTAGSRNGTCDWLLSSESLRASGDSEGIFLSVAHWYPPHTSCTYLMQGEEDEVVRLYFPSFRINRIESPIKPIEGDCGESLTLYDASWPDDAKIIKTFCDTFSKAMEKHDFVSTGNSLFVRFESKTGSYSGSSLYYWAHYDFFNNTKLGEAVPGRQCDEIFSSWKQVKGWLRSPLNTLVYKTPQTSEDVSCLYRFVTDKRLFARVILTINNVYFKESPYNHGPCTNCLEDRVDKLVIWEPLLPGANSTHPPISLNKAAQNGDVTCICNRQAFSTQIISKGEQLNLQMIVDSTHSALSYFKHSASLFEATYEFVHGPLCGPAIIQPITDGEIHYPYYEAIGYVEPPKSIRCIWEIKVNRERDFWLHFDQIKFSSKSCDDGIVDIFLKGRLDPYLSVCGENVSLAKELPILSSAELSPDGTDPSITIQFIGRTSPTRAAFKIAWTEMFHLPRNVDGSSLMSSRLTEGGNPEDPLGDGCEFACPGEQGLCIPARLVCNGVVNCPNVTDYKGTAYSDEATELCIKENSPEINWVYVGIATVSVLFLLCCCCVCACKRCCRYCCRDDDD
ncbi:cubilin homolog [Diabrotica undecimpunctata]|uniref:cubilin homolog n=1 Tax=Diabrotica undecimpunctata TaxID=50387 RepID=UPI003B63DCD5